MTQPVHNAPTITLSTAAIVKAAVAIIALWVIYLTADILLLVLASIFLAAAVGPWVDSLQKYHIPRPVSMLIIYAILFAVVSSAIILIIPPVAEEIKIITQNFPSLSSNFIAWMTNLNPSATAMTTTIQDLSQTITTATQGILSTLSSIFGGIFSFFMILVMTFYLVVDQGAVKRTVAIFPVRHQTYLTNLYDRLQKQIGLWLRAQLILMGLVGLIIYILMTLIGMPYALVLAIVAGLAEFIPYLGPLIGALPAVILASAVSPTMAIVVAVIYYGVQLFENNVLTPKIMEKALGLSPIVSIVVFLVGAKLGGMAGAFLAIPIATAAGVVIKELLNKRGEKIAPTGA